MSASFVLPLGVNGLVKADIPWRAYVDGVRNQGIENALVFIELAGGDGDYVVSELPDGASNTLITITWEDPASVGGSNHYPLPTVRAPKSIVLPVRVTGLTAVDLDLTLYKDGADAGLALIFSEPEAGLGDYVVSGWPLTTGGHWVLVWRHGGTSYSADWVVPTIGAAPWIQEDHELFMGPLVDGVDSEHLDQPRLDFSEPDFSSNPSAPAYFFRPRWEYQKVREEQFEGTDPDRSGTLFVELWIQPGSGGRVMELLSDLIALYETADLVPLRGADPVPLLGGRVFGDGGSKWWVEGIAWNFEITP